VIASGRSASDDSGRSDMVMFYRAQLRVANNGTLTSADVSEP